MSISNQPVTVRSRPGVGSGQPGARPTPPGGCQDQSTRPRSSRRARPPTTSSHWGRGRVLLQQRCSTVQENTNNCRPTCGPCKSGVWSAQCSAAVWSVPGSRCSGAPASTSPTLTGWGKQAVSGGKWGLPPPPLNSSGVDEIHVRLLLPVWGLVTAGQEPPPARGGQHPPQGGRGADDAVPEARHVPRQGVEKLQGMISPNYCVTQLTHRIEPLCSAPARPGGRTGTRCGATR